MACTLIYLEQHESQAASLATSAIPWHKLLRAAVTAESAMITTRVQRLIESIQAVECGATLVR